MTIRLADFQGVCSPVPYGPGEICVTLPGGVQLCAYEYQDTGDAGAVVNALLGQISTALTPLAPFFNVLEFVQAVLAFAEGVPKAITGNPKPMIDATISLTSAVNKLVAMVPQASVPIMVKGIIGVVIAGLVGIRAQMQAMILQQARVTRALDKANATGIAPLMVIATCAQDNLDVQLVNLNASFTPLNRLIALVNFFLELIKAPCIPVIGSLPGVGTDALYVLDVTIDVLQTMLAAIPGVDTPPLAAQDC